MSLEQCKMGKIDKQNLTDPLSGVSDDIFEEFHLFFLQ